MTNGGLSKARLDRMHEVTPLERLFKSSEAASAVETG